MFLETPAPNQTITGVLFTRGWAVAPAGIAEVEIYIDGNFILDIPLGESRPAVGDIYPSYPDSDTAGFNIGLFYSRFAAGLHTATVRAIDTNGDYKEVSNAFTITRFDTSEPNNFIRDPSKIDLTEATVSLDGNTIAIDGFIVDSMSYRVRMEWNTTLQGLAISQITKNPPPPPVDACANIAGRWNGSEEATFTCCVAGVCETASVTGKDVIYMRQNACNVSYSLTLQGLGTFQRTGAINGHNMQLSGKFMILQPGCSATRNTINITGTVDGSRINWQGVGAANGRCGGVRFSCTGRSTAILTR